MGTVMVVLFFFIYLLFTASYFAIAYFYGNFIATLEGGMFYFQLVLLCLALLVVWAGFIYASAKFMRYGTKTHNMFKKTDKYGLKSTSAFGIGTFAVLSIACALLYYFVFLIDVPDPELVEEVVYIAESALIMRYVTNIAVLAYTIANYVLYIWMWGRTQTYQWCPKCGRFWGKSYYVADEIGREAHEYKYKERERASTVENAQGQLVASVYNDVEKTGYTVRYYYRLRHHCKYCGDWEEQINIEKPTMFDGAWIEPYNSADVSEHINVTLTSEQKSTPVQPSSQLNQAEPTPQLSGAQAPQVRTVPYDDNALLENIAIKQLSDKN